jgi:hypothetical protein
MRHTIKIAALSQFCAIRRLALFSLIVLILSSLAVLAQEAQFQPNLSAGPTGIIVHSKFGGQIFGFDVDQNGSEGLLTEAKTLAGGNVLAAVETFDQATGNILKVVELTQPSHAQDDFVTLGVVGNSVGLYEHEHVSRITVSSRTFNVLNPLSSNRITGAWTPPIGSQHIIMPSGVSRNQGVPNVAVFAYDNSGQFVPWVFSSNVANNTFGPVVRITDATNFGSVPPPIAYDSVTNQALLGGGNGCFGCSPVFALVDLATSAVTEFNGFGFGFINGLAIDSADGIAVSTTEDDASVEFFDIRTHTGSVVVLPGSQGLQQFSAADVEFDPVHKLFLIAQPFSSSAPSGSTIYAYDIHGNLQETINGLDFSNTFNVVPAHIALHPGTRSGYIDGPDSGVTELQGFTY